MPMRPTRPSPPADIGPDLFSHFRSPIRGSGNPSVMTNPVWAWITEHRLHAWSANIAFGGPPSKEAGPCWSFSREGPTETTLPDGRIVRIGGEHEDHYDPDFYIYNDVIVRDATGRIEIFGYSEEAFPPTDFHTATLVGDRIFVIGSLSYHEHRKLKAQVLVLDTTSYSFEHFDATGENPPWLHKHSSELVENGSAIVVRGGLIVDPRWPVLVENIDDWRLDLSLGRWDRLTNRAWPRFAFLRVDRMSNQLYWLRSLRREIKRGKHDSFAARQFLDRGDLNAASRVDLLETLYTPDVPHVTLPKIEGEYRVHPISIDGVTIRYVEGNPDIALTIEGSLPAEVVERLRLDLLTKLAAVENTDFDCIPVVVD